jgi:hypothetical protein
LLPLDPIVYVLANLLAALAILCVPVAYRLHHKYNHDDLAHKLAAVVGSLFTLRLPEPAATAIGRGE